MADPWEPNTEGIRRAATGIQHVVMPLEFDRWLAGVKAEALSEFQEWVSARAASFAGPPRSVGYAYAVATFNLVTEFRAASANAHPETEPK